MFARILLTAWEFFKPISKDNPEKQQKLLKVNIPSYPAYVALWVLPGVLYGVLLSRFLPKNEDVLPLLLLILFAYVLSSLTAGVITVLFGHGVNNKQEPARPNP